MAPTALRHDMGMLHARIVANSLNLVNHVIGVLFQGIVDARLEVRLRSIVIDSQAAADVQVLDSRASLDQLSVNPCRFVKGALDDPECRESGCPGEENAGAS